MNNGTEPYPTAAPHPNLARQSASDIKLGLERITTALKALGAPERRLPPVIHVAGTNGKGSVIAFLKAILEAGGFRVHAFTSPALTRAGEQIVVAGAPIAEDALTALADEVSKAAPEPLTPFETLTASAFLAFARAPADVALIETGFGGRLDATNVVARPAFTIVTPIDLDHIAFLGDGIANIAAAKAGILKARVPAVIGPQSDTPLAVLEAEAARLNVPLCVYGRDWQAYEDHGRLAFQHEHGLLDLPLPPLPGRHQIDNAGAALAAIKALGGLGLDEATLARGIAATRWPARLERLATSPWLSHLPPGSDLWRDGAHNPHAARALAQFLVELGKRNPKPLTVILGLRADKNARAVFAALKPAGARLIAIPLPDKDGAEPVTLVQAATSEGLVAESAASFADAIARVAKGTAQRVVLTGSLSLMRLATPDSGHV